ncbi:BON domain-containing protein [Pseudomonas mangrovi]|uniref:Osmotically-inducible protein Y n=1 Tax=Pseudomonas mangrovi TaxID=2161748 RepID=A0A2T5P862_9PSED|nr:BON domain-containing protein [Pseudomonas mangrovi]PTU73939.1 phospholipid-binding protein [Pseudomonas mangrovi]
MTTVFNKKWTLAALAASALSLSVSQVALAENTAQQATSAPLMLAGDKMDKAGDAVSDTWITSKVKSSFLADDSISGLDIKVETNQGVVSLSGVVPSDAERDLAVEKARAIEGVRDVSADGLKSSE